MNRYVLIGTGKDYVKRVWESEISREDVTWFDEPFLVSLKPVKALAHIHSSFLLNRYFNLPFRGIWEKAGSINHVKINEEDFYYFLLFDNTLARYTPAYISNFKKQHRNAAFILFLDNAMHKKERLILQHLDGMDLVYTNNKFDAEKYGFRYKFNIIPPLTTETSNQTIKWDVFFVGNATDRLDIIHAVYDRLDELGLKTLMYISGVKPSQISRRNNIIYNQHLSYSRVTEFYDQSRCLLEVVGKKPTMLTMRMMEALRRNKKLLTNHPFILEQNFYDPRYIQYFKNPEDIDKAFFEQNTDVDYRFQDNSPESFLKQIVSDYQAQRVNA